MLFRSATQDALLEVAKTRCRYPGLKIVAGFAAESEDLLVNAEKKMKRKRLDLIVANDISAKDRGMGADDNAATILFASGTRKEIPLMKKDALAAEVIEAIAGKLR